MNDGQFLFELPSRSTAEYVLSGWWAWKKVPVDLQWWSLTMGCWPVDVSRDWVWIRVMGLPLSMWSKEVFKRIEDMCRGFIEMEKEKSLKNHLH